MNFHKLMHTFISRPSFCNYRTYSAYNLTFDRRLDCSETNHNNLFKKKTLLGNINKRNISIESVVKWQEQTYMSISNSSLVNVIQDGLLYFHDTTGLTWSATIITSTILVRALMTLPLSVYQNYILAKVENIGLELRDLSNELKKETAIAKKMYSLSDKQAMILYKRSLKKQWKKLIERDNCHPLKATLVIWLQLPIWVCMSFALRNLVNMHPSSPSAMITFMELQNGGFGWIPNLTESDHSLILPLTFGIANIAIIEVQRLSKLREPSKIYNIFTNVFRVFSIAMIPVAASVPSCMCLYWTTSSVFGLAQNLSLLSPTLRRKLKIPEAPSELEHPYSHMKEEINKKIRKLLPKKLL
ncbi:cytochrome c oxidase assembly protein COX18, mitochondrial [Vanessa atalanta]|uniref:cytochrome c oxidase assembly protein COX18, mitochondrial n=1 Tax=Vanessa atalanta TaxID=42275 RepID=UPI001FCDBA06|nr:cytochrome c oxidase assembly protein COX18, mitochondrial [Vanessa atalanta]